MSELKACTNCKNYYPDDERECTVIEQTRMEHIFDAWEDQVGTQHDCGLNCDQYFAKACKKWQAK